MEKVGEEEATVALINHSFFFFLIQLSPSLGSMKKGDKVDPVQYGFELHRSTYMDFFQ